MKLSLSLKEQVEQLKEKLVEIAHLSSILAMANWDQEVHMPSKASDSRAVASGHLSAVIHSRILSLDEGGLLSNLKKRVDNGKKSNNKGKKIDADLTDEDQIIVKETWKSFERQRKLPENFVREMTEVTSKSQSVWAEARAKNDFNLFLPWLTKVVNLKKKEAELVGFKNSPYDALIEAYEPGMTAEQASRILNDLKSFLIPFLKEMQEAKKANGKGLDKKKIEGDFDLDTQYLFNVLIAEKMGFNMQSGKIDKSTHPFTTAFHPHDVRFTTRYRKDDVLYSIASTIHEAGHALYEQGLPSEHFGTPLAEAVSLGIHESQSRMWENIIGKSQSFWKFFYPQLQKEFPAPFKKLSLSDFLEIINEVRPSLIRTESDEVTYNLHIIMRFEIERAMIEGTIALKDLPKIWKKKVKEYLDIDVPDDTRGVLQDVHWSCGLIGYFPTYSFGNLYAAQFYFQMIKDIPDFSEQVEKGNFKNILEWLRKKIHIHGKTHTASALVKKVTGEELDSKYFKKYLEKKYGKM
jgi:carboxypeptidase Taq